MAYQFKKTLFSVPHIRGIFQVSKPTDGKRQDTKILKVFAIPREYDFLKLVRELVFQSPALDTKVKTTSKSVKHDLFLHADHLKWIPSLGKQAQDIPEWFQPILSE
jgi:hypothetical protein